MEKFQQRFIEEAHDFFDNLESALLGLEDDLTDQQSLAEIFRVMHTLKGSGAMFGFDLLSEITHDLESLFVQVRNGQLALNPEIVSFTLNSVDQLRQLLISTPTIEERDTVDQMKAEISSFISRGAKNEVSHQVPETGSPDYSEINERSLFIYFKPSEDIFSNGTNPLYLVDELCALGSSSVKVGFDQLPDIEDFDTEKCYADWRVLLVTNEAIEVIRDVFLFVQDNSIIKIINLQDGNVLQDKQKAEVYFSLPLEEIKPFEVQQNESAPDDRPVSKPPAKTITEKRRQELVSGVQLSTIRVSAVKIDEYMNLVSEMITAQSRLDLMAERNKELEPVSEHFSKLVRQLRDNAFNMSLIPLNNMATRFKRLVRDLSAELNKEVELVTEGLETEVDKNIIEKLGEPLLHIIRNCIDHGIEPVDERLAKGKTREGVIIIKAGCVGTFVEIDITDDGRGLDLEKIRSKAIKKSMIGPDEELDDPALIALIFEPGFSTSENLSDVSGRGEGMDIVRQRIRDLHGDVKVDTKKGEGVNFTIRLPLTLSIIDGLLTRVNSDMYVIPTAPIEKIYALTADKRRGQLRQVFVFEGQEIPYLDLRKEFDPMAEALDQQYLIAVKYKNSLFGLVVDDVVREYQAVVKPLGEMMKHHDLFLGASILGDGKVSLVIDVKKTIQKFST